MNKYDIKTRLFAEEEIKKRIDHKTASIFIDKPFRVRAYPVYIIALCIGVFCQMLSAITEGYMIFNWLVSFGVVAAVGVALLVLVCIEGLKRWSSNEFTTNLVNYKTFGVFAFVILATMQTLSIFISYEGAKQLPKELTQKPVKATPVLVSIPEIRERFDNAIDKQDKAIKAYFESNKKPNKVGGFRLSSRYMKHYNSMLSHKQSLEAEKIQVINQAKQDNKKAAEVANIEHLAALEEYNNRLQKEGSIFGLLSLIIEGVFLLSFAVMFYYLKRSHNEKNAHQEQQTNSERPINTSTNTKTNEQPQHVTLVAKQNTKPATFKDFNNTYTIKCQTCGTLVTTTKQTTKYCSSKCRSKAYRLRNQSK